MDNILSTVIVNAHVIRRLSQNKIKLWRIM